MAKIRLLVPILLLFVLTVCFASCGNDDVTTQTPNETTTTAVSTTTTAVVTTTEPPVTTEDPFFYGTQGLIFESGNDGTATVVGISDATAKEIRVPKFSPDGDRVIAIGYGAFVMNTVIETVMLPSTVFKIENSAFYGCISLKTVSFSEGLEEIGSGAFQECAALESITLPSTLAELSPLAFSGCTSLRHLTVSANNPFFTAEGNCLVRKNERTVLLGCVGSKIPKDIVKIEAFAFYNAGLTELLMPDSVKEVGNQAFAQNKKLTTLVLSESLTTLGDLAFADCIALDNMYLPAALTEIGTTPFRNCKSVTRFVVSQDNSAYYAEGLCLIRKGDGTLVQGFVGATIPNEVRAIGEYAFAFLPLYEIAIPKSVSEIGANAFAYCDALSGVTLEKNLTSVAPNAFYQSLGIKTVAFGGTKASFDALFAEVSLPEGVTVTYRE